MNHSQKPPVPSPPPERPIKSPGITLTTVAIILSGFGVVLVLGGLLTWFGDFFTKCENDNLRPMPSPDGKLKAILYRRSCGETTAYSTHVTVIGADKELPDASGNAFIANGEPAVILRWLDAGNLIIETPSETSVMFRAKEVAGVAVGDR